MKTQAAINTYVREIGGWVASQLEACTRCGLCADACHFYQATGNPEYAPVWKAELLRRAYEQRFTIAGRLKLAVGMDRPVTDEDLAHWSTIVYEACTLCNKCAMVCPMGIQLGPLIHDVRSGMAASGVVPADLVSATTKQKDIGSPLGVTDTTWAERMEWIGDEWEVKIPVDEKGADTLVVFTSIELMKFPDNIAAIATIMDKSGEKWTTSSKGREVVNFGYFEADEELTKLFLRRVFEAAKELGVKRIMISECGHAYDAMRWTAANIMDVPKGVEVTHIIRMMYDFWKAGRIRLKKGAYDDGTITFHDSCKIQRRGGHIKEPREILKWLAPESFKEMTPNKEQALCCGGGGGVISIQEADPLRFAVFGMKIEQMKEIGAKSVCMVCSNCRLQFAEGVAHFNSDVKVHGLSEMVAQALE
jgi:Fe-S oxidoreductase